MLTCFFAAGGGGIHRDLKPSSTNKAQKSKRPGEIYKAKVNMPESAQAYIYT